jgi:hypothetical protein
VLHVLGGGPGVNGSADAFRIVYQPLNGDGEVTARVLGQRSLDPQIATRPDAMAGVMIRDNAGADARQVSVVTTPGNGLSLRWRDSSGGQVGSTTVSNVGAPLWVRVRRTGNTFNGYYSNNGLSWTQIGTGHTVPMSAGTLGGVVAAGGPEVGLTRARFDQVQVTGGSTLPLPPVVAEARPLGARQGWRSAPGSGTYRVRKDSPDTGPFEVP